MVNSRFHSSRIYMGLFKCARFCGPVRYTHVVFYNNQSQLPHYQGHGAFLAFNNGFKSPKRRAPWHVLVKKGNSGVL